VSVKKKTPVRKVAKAKVDTPTTAQSAAARRSAEAELSASVAKFAPTQLRLVRAIRKSLQKCLPTANEVVYEYENLGAVVISYSPNEHGYDGVLAIRGSAEGVKLYFNQGKNLPDPEKLLKGSSQTRFIALESASTLDRPPVARLIEEALAHNRVPFAPDGRGSVIIRSAAVKKRPQRRST
jgi:hypothetical protein